MSLVENLRLLHVEEVIFTADCTAWTEQRSSQILDGLLFIVKRTIEPRFRIILQPAWPVNTLAAHCAFCLVESFDQTGRFEELKPRFVLPSQGFVVFFNNLEDSTRAAECITGLVDTTAPTGRTTEITEDQRDNVVDPSIRTNEITEEQSDNVVDPSIRTNEIIEEQRESAIDRSVSINIWQDVEASGTPENPQLWDEKVYLQNTRVIMAMIAVLLATIVLSVGLNPPSYVNTLPDWIKIIFQITFWIAAISSLAALFLLGVVNPTSFEMQSRIFRCAFVPISVALVCVLVAFGATTISIATNLFTGIIGVVIGAIGVILFSYFTSKTVRDFKRR